MNKKSLLIIGIIVIVIGASVAFLAFRSEDNMEEQPVIDMSSQSSQQNTASDQSSSAQIGSTVVGMYIDYNPEMNFDFIGTKVLFFHAPWCPQCRELDADIKKQQLPGDLTIIKVDYDTNQELRQKYGVTIQTTLVKVDDNGELVEKYVAYNEPSFAAVKENLL